MSPRYLRFGWSGVLVILLALMGCRTSAPRIAPAPGSPEAMAMEKAVLVDRQAFAVVPLTNRIDPNWLTSPTNLFTLGPGDLIDLEILGDPGSAGQALVGPDGKIYYSLLPGTFVWGKTLTEAKGEIDRELQKYFRDAPQVAISLRGVGSKRIWILGSVGAPGVYPLDRPITILEALLLAGGAATQGAPDDVADYANSFVMRDGQPLAINFESLLRRGDLSQNIYLQSDDFVYIRPSQGRSIHVFGAVGGPTVIPSAPNVTLLSAITRAGGPAPYARVHKVVILRGGLSNPRVTDVDFKAIAKGLQPDVVLEPGDLVFVPFVPYKKLAELGQSVLFQFVRTLALNEGRNAVGRDRTPVGVVVAP
jgi:polysaccharide biosynthesis/export protein